MNLQRWLQDHSLKLLAIRDTPEAIAGGVAIGILFGFTPLFGLKTLGAMLLAWLTRSNILAAVIAVTLHDLILPLMPFLYFSEYRLGYWILNHEWPRRGEPSSYMHLRWHELRNWSTLTQFGHTITVDLVGSIVCALPAAVIGYFVTKMIIVRHRLKKARVAAEAARAGEQPDRDEGPLV